jgi:hypothetical protein
VEGRVGRTIKLVFGMSDADGSRKQRKAAEVVLNNQEAHHFGPAVSCPDFCSQNLDVTPPITSLSKLST